MIKRELHLTPRAPGQRLDLFVLAHVDSLSRAQVQRMIRDGLVRVNDQVEKAGFKVKGGESIRVCLPAPVNVAIEPEDIALDVVYEDADLAVINKPAGLGGASGRGA